MARSSISHCADPGIRRGAWSKEEDVLLRRCVEKYGEGKWHLVPSRAGLRRCRKSCRLRWFNYLSPNIKRGSFAPDEDDLIIRMQRLLGNRWSLIAGRIIGRTANDIKNRWNSHLSKKTLTDRPPKQSPPVTSFVVVKPKAYRPALPQAYRPTTKAPYWIKPKAQAGDAQPAGNFQGEQFCFSSWFHSKSSAPGGRGGGGGEVEAPHQTRAESSLLPELLLDLDGIEFPIQAMTTDPTEEELEWQKLLSDPDFGSLEDIDGGAIFEPAGKTGSFI